MRPKRWRLAGRNSRCRNIRGEVFLTSSGPLAIQQRGWQTQSQLALSWLQRIVPREAIDHIARRYWSSSWRIPDAIFAASIQRLEQWAQEYFGSDIDRLQSQERHFFIQTTQL